MPEPANYEMKTSKQDKSKHNSNIAILKNDTIQIFQMECGSEKGEFFIKDLVLIPPRFRMELP